MKFTIYSVCNIELRPLDGSINNQIPEYQRVQYILMVCLFFIYFFIIVKIKYFWTVCKYL